MSQHQHTQLLTTTKTEATTATLVNPNTAGNSSCKVCGSQNHMTSKYIRIK